MKRKTKIKLPDKTKVPMLFTLSGLMLTLWISIILLVSVITTNLSGAERYIFLTTLREAIVYILLSLMLVIGGGFFLDYCFCKSCEK